MLPGAISGWVALACIPVAALAGLFFRRLRDAPRMVVRMRPHFVIGYAALIAGLVHASFAMGSASGALGAGIRFAVLALIVIAVQAFIGASLQDPGRFRRPLRGMHIALFALGLVLAFAHAMLNSVLLTTTASLGPLPVHHSAAIADATSASAIGRSTRPTIPVPPKGD